MITPVLLCGGSGTRLWPLSRRSYPKQFVPLIGGDSLFQMTLKRLTGQGFARPVILTGEDFRFIVTEQMAACRIDPAAILIEPESRDTAPAILAAALHAHAQDPDAMLLIAPSDHVLPDTERFAEAVARGLPAAGDGRIVTFGIRPDRAETGYGYLELRHGAETHPGVFALDRFIEKPNQETALVLSQSDRHCWIAGIFLASAATLIAAFEAHAPQLTGGARAALDGGRPDLSFLRLAVEPWAALPSVSVDYAVMEKAPNLSVVPYDGAWSDLGGWDAVWREMPHDAAGVAQAGPVVSIDCGDSLLRSEADGVALVGIGLHDIVAVATQDAVLVADRTRAQDVKAAVAALKANGAKQAETFPRDHRPWGWFETLVLGERFQVKRIVVHPGAALSLQTHHHRAEHWIVVTGTARVTKGDEVRLVTENESVYIPLGMQHRLENPGKLPMVLIEVQSGAYLGEDDIQRLDDVYARD